MHKLNINILTELYYSVHFYIVYYFYNYIVHNTNIIKYIIRYNTGSYGIYLMFYNFRFINDLQK